MNEKSQGREQSSTLNTEPLRLQTSADLASSSIQPQNKLQGKLEALQRNVRRMSISCRQEDDDTYEEKKQQQQLFGNFIGSHDSDEGQYLVIKESIKKECNIKDNVSHHEKLSGCFQSGNKKELAITESAKKILSVTSDNDLERLTHHYGDGYEKVHSSSQVNIDHDASDSDGEQSDLTSLEPFLERNFSGVAERTTALVAELFQTRQDLQKAQRQRDEYAKLLLLPNTSVNGSKSGDDNNQRHNRRIVEELFKTKTLVEAMERECTTLRKALEESHTVRERQAKIIRFFQKSSKTSMTTTTRHGGNTDNVVHINSTDESGDNNDDPKGLLRTMEAEDRIKSSTAVRRSTDSSGLPKRKVSRPTSATVSRRSSTDKVLSKMNAPAKSRRTIFW